MNVWDMLVSQRLTLQQVLMVFRAVSIIHTSSNLCTWFRNTPEEVKIINEEVRDNPNIPELEFREGDNSDSESGNTIIGGEDKLE
jgi:hypothetical protein